MIPPVAGKAEEQGGLQKLIAAPCGSSVSVDAVAALIANRRGFFFPAAAAASALVSLRRAAEIFKGRLAADDGSLGPALKTMIGPLQERSLLSAPVVKGKLRLSSCCG